MSFENLTPPIRLSYRRRAILDKLVTSDVADQLLAREEETTLNARRKLITERDALPAKAVTAQKVAEKRIAEAVTRHEAAQRELRAANDEVNAARSAVFAADPARRIFEITRELQRTADPRLSDFRFELSRIAESYLPAVYRIALVEDPSVGFGRRERLSSNVAEIAAARKAIGDACSRLDVLSLEALARSEVTVELFALIEDLRPALDAVGLTPPGLDPAEFEVTSMSNKDYGAEVARLKKGADAAAA